VGTRLLSPFLRATQALQDHAHWRETVEQMLTMWLSGAPASVDAHIRNEMESHGFEDWARAGRVSPPVPVLHVYVEPRAPLSTSRHKSHSLGSIRGSLYAV
jgi:hypothetical protein